MTAADEPEIVEQRPPIAYTLEGDGSVATCQGCGWAIWKPNRHDAEAAAADHKKCRADDVKLYARIARARRPTYARRPRIAR